MLCIYDKKTIKGNFDNNGLGVLNESILAEVTEELNGQYYLEIEYPANSKKAIYLKEFNIIKADNQLFRIYKVEKVQDTDKRVKVYANHIFYDMDYYFIEDKRVENAPIKTAMEKALVNDLDKIYTVDSDVVKAETLYMIEISPVQAFFKMIERWEQGELLRDNFTVKILRQVGNDSGVLIKYGKNIQGLKITVDTANVVTKIYPKGANGIKLSEKYINVPNWDSELYPPFPIIRKVEFKDAQDEVTLRSLTTELATTIGLSTINIQIDFIELSKIREYENYKKLEMVNIGDIVTVKHSDFDIDVKVKVIKIKKDILTGLNTKVELGQPLDDFVTSIDPTKIIKTVTDDLGNQVAQALTSMLYYANSQSLQINTTSKQFIYIGVGAIANTNLTLLLAIYGVAEEECTITIKIQLDNNDITFTPKVKLQQGDNTIGIPLGIPQVSEGAHYIGVFISTDSGVFNIPIWNLQLMIDGRNLQGGLSAEPPHAEAKEYQLYISNIAGVEKQNDTVISINSKVGIINNSLSENLSFNYIVSYMEDGVENIKEDVSIELIEN